MRNQHCQCRSSKYQYTPVPRMLMLSKIWSLCKKLRILNCIFYNFSVFSVLINKSRVRDLGFNLNLRDSTFLTEFSAILAKLSVSKPIREHQTHQSLNSESIFSHQKLTRSCHRQNYAFAGKIGLLKN